jgi:hypothetical protein
VITTGMRLMLGGVVVMFVGAWVYGMPRGGTLGTTGLIFAFSAFVLLAIVTIVTRDSNVSSLDPTATTEAAAARPAPQPSPWPLVGALGGALVVVGLATFPVVFVFGVVALLATTIEWMVEAWSERASADVAYNGEIRERIAHPAEFPVLAALVMIVVVYSFSRIMLFLSKEAGPVMFGAIAVLVLAGGFLFAYRPRIDNRVLATVGAAAMLLLVAGGVAAALAGEREIRHEETTATLAAEGRCATAEETEADHNASQTVAAKANVAAEITLNADGTLVAEPLGATADTPPDQLVVSRSTESNFLFHNETDTPRRLVLDMGTRPVGEDSTQVEPNQLCTALVEEDGSEFLSFRLDELTSADTNYRFFVPGVEGQAIEVIVP